MVKEGSADTIPDMEVNEDVASNPDSIKFVNRNTPARKIDSKGQEYLLYSDGQLRRLSADGTPLPRLRLSKKERLRLRRELKDVQSLNEKELVNKILETSVINPLVVKNA